MGLGESFLLKNTDRRLSAGSWQGSDQSLGVGTSKGQEEECWGQAGPQSLWMASSSAPRPPRHPDSRPPGTEDKGPFPPCQPSCSQDCVARPFDQTKDIMSADKCFKYQGFRAGSRVPLVFPVKRIMPGPLRISASSAWSHLVSNGAFRCCPSTYKVLLGDGHGGHILNIRPPSLLFLVVAPQHSLQIPTTEWDPTHGLGASLTKTYLKPWAGSRDARGSALLSQLLWWIRFHHPANLVLSFLFLENN